MRDESTSLSLTMVLERHWRALIHESSASESSFAADFREHFERFVPAHARTIEFSQADDLVKRMTRDAEKLSRWFKYGVQSRFPVEALEAFVQAFPGKRRWALQQEIASRQGLLAVPLPQCNGTGDAANLGRIGKETGEAIVAVSELLDDGVIDRRDDVSKMVYALVQIDEAMAVLMEMRTRIEQQVDASKNNTMRRVK